MARRSIFQTLTALAMIALAGCQSPESHPAPTATAPPAVAAPAAAPTLASQTGKTVHLEGEFRGPGKLADYIVVEDRPLYLIDPDFGGESVSYGVPVSVDGILQHSPGMTSDKNDVQSEPAHYYIEHPRVRRLDSKQ